MAVDGQHIYWITEQLAGTVARANLDGSGITPNFITGANSPEGVAVDSGHL